MEGLVTSIWVAEGFGFLPPTFTYSPGLDIPSPASPRKETVPQNQFTGPEVLTLWFWVLAPTLPLASVPLLSPISLLHCTHHLF